jgi:large subunit ribosomal protein L21
MFAVIKSGGRQYKVSVGQTLEVNRLAVEDGEQVLIDEVLLISDADNTMVGTPFVANASVVATAVRQARGEKLVVFRYKPKKRFRHRRGHRQELTVLSIDDIVANGKSLITGEAPKEKTVAEDEGVATSANAATVAPVEETPLTETEQRTRRRRTSSEGSSESTTEE